MQRWIKLFPLINFAELAQIWFRFLWPAKRQMVYNFFSKKNILFPFNLYKFLFYLDIQLDYHPLQGEVATLYLYIYEELVGLFVCSFELLLPFKKKIEKLSEIKHNKEM